MAAARRNCPSKWTAPFCAFLSAFRFNGSVIDVGAAFGFEIEASLSAGHPVVGIECRFDEFRRLHDRFASHPRVRLLHACASNSSGARLLHRALDSSSLHPRALDPVAWKRRRERSRVELVPAVTVDQVAAAMRLRVGLVKVDVQGHEEQVLLGARRLIAAQRPLLFFECDAQMGCGNRSRIFTDVIPEYFCECRGDCACVFRKRSVIKT